MYFRRFSKTNVNINKTPLQSHNGHFVVSRSQKSRTLIVATKKIHLCEDLNADIFTDALTKTVTHS